MVNDDELSGWWLTYPSEKYESQWERWQPIYEMENNPFMFQTTNQNMFHKAQKFGQG